LKEARARAGARLSWRARPPAAERRTRPCAPFLPPPQQKRRAHTHTHTHNTHTHTPRLTIGHIAKRTPPPNKGVVRHPPPHFCSLSRRRRRGDFVFLLLVCSDAPTTTATPKPATAALLFVLCLAPASAGTIVVIRNFHVETVRQAARSAAASGERVRPSRVRPHSVREPLRRPQATLHTSLILLSLDRKSTTLFLHRTHAQPSPRTHAADHAGVVSRARAPMHGGTVRARPLWPIASLAPAGDPIA
jgi:hypothetical protein